MRTVGFVGPSGTGKSHRAIWVARENNIDCVIDDGLLIKGNRVIAGSSAKKESTKLASVRRALFTDPNHARQVKEAIRTYKPEAVMILGTSLNMVESIALALELPQLSNIIYIEQVAKPEEIQMAQMMRREQGKHVIPVPTFEIKKDFSGYFIDPLRIFRRQSKDNSPFYADKSVVRPTFSYLGKYTISDHVIHSICQYEAENSPYVVKVNKLWSENKPTGLIVFLEITMEYGVNLPEASREVQKRVASAVEQTTAMNVAAVNITVKSLVVR